MVQLFGSKKEPWVDGGEPPQAAESTQADGQAINGGEGRSMLDLGLDDEDNEKTSIVDAKDMNAMLNLAEPPPPSARAPPPAAAPAPGKTMPMPRALPPRGGPVPPQSLPALPRTQTPQAMQLPPPRPLPVSAAHAAAKASAAAGEAAAEPLPPVRPSGRIPAARPGPTVPPIQPSATLMGAAPVATPAGLQAPRRPSRTSGLSQPPPMAAPPPLEFFRAAARRRAGRTLADLTMEPVYPEAMRAGGVRIRST